MKLKLFLFALLIVGMGFGGYAQNSINVAGNEIPESFFIEKNELNQLLSLKTNEMLIESKNKYINRSVLQMISAAGDMKSLKLKLDYFPNAYLFVQINGSFSTQIFVMTDDKSVFYKSDEKEKKFVMNKCSEDEIISE